MDDQVGRSKRWADLREVLAGTCCLIGAWLIAKGVQIDPQGGAAVVSVVHGSETWSRSWHLGWSKGGGDGEA